MTRASSPQLLLLLTLGAAAFPGAGCRGQTSREPPIHLNPNMDHQERAGAQEESAAFADRRAMRPEVPGTIAQGELRADDHLHRGLQAGQPAEELPVKLDWALLQRGRERYDIFCAVCHDAAGTGEGMVVQRGMVPPPNFTERRLRTMPIGQIYRVIMDGVRSMPPYRQQVAAADRWAISAYVRALQISRSAGLKDVPPDVAQMKGWNP